jgi:hypothetical protein
MGQGWGQWREAEVEMWASVIGHGKTLDFYFEHERRALKCFGFFFFLNSFFFVE